MYILIIHVLLFSLLCFPYYMKEILLRTPHKNNLSRIKTFTSFLKAILMETLGQVVG